MTLNLKPKGQILKRYTSSKPSNTTSSNTRKYTLPKKPEMQSFSRGSISPSIGGLGSNKYSSGKKYNYQSTDQNNWSAPQFNAYARLNNSDIAIDTLTYSNNTRGTKFWNPYRGGGSVLPPDMVQYYRDRGYDGPFDWNFVNQQNELYGNDVDFTRTYAVATPNKQSSEAEWAGYYANSLANALHDNDELDEQYSEVLKKYSDFYDQYKQINGREPTLEEFENAVDRSKYSKLQAIDDSLVYATKEQTLPNGTFYSPDIIPGIYLAKQNGEELNIGTDYYQYAVQHWMNPVQNAPSVQKYDWSNDDLSAVSQEDRDKYVNLLKSQGLNEEAAAYKYCWWAAQPHDDSISAEPSILDAAYGYDHTREWHDKVEESIGAEYRARLNYDGTMNSPGSKADYMDRACYELYQVNKTFDATNNIEDEWNGLINAAIDYTNRHLADYNVNQYEDFVFSMLDELGISQSAWESDESKNLSNLSSGLNDYLNNGYDPDKHCRELNISKANLNTIFKRLWDGKDVRTGVDYAADVDEDYEPNKGDVQPDELPLMYNEQQRAMANQRSADRANAEKAVVESTLNFANSGAQAEKGSVNVVTDTFARMADLGDALYGVLAKVWKDTRQEAHNEKIGEEHSLTEAAAIDPVQNQLDSDNMPEAVTVDDIKKLADAYVMSRAFDDDITLVHGILGYALPGIEYLRSAISDNPNVLGDAINNVADTFNTLTYKDVYEDRVNAGYSEEEAASTALFAATSVDQSLNEVNNRYAGDEALENATSELINDIYNEDGAKDTYTLLKAINDDIKEAWAPYADKIKPGLEWFNAAMIVGASAHANPGFRAETNQMLHDIIVGDITPDDIIEATSNEPEDLFDAAGFKPAVEEPVEFGDFLSSLGTDTEAEKRLGPAKDISLIELSNGRMLTEGQYSDIIANQGKEWLKSAEGFFSSGNAYENIPDDVKDIIDYDGIMQLAKERYGEDAKYYSDFMVHDAVEALVNPDKVLHTSPLMNGRGTDMLGQIDELASGKTEEQVLANQAKTGQSWLENFARGKGGGIAAALYAYSGNDQSDIGNIADMLRVYGKFMSTDEADALWNNFTSGRLDYNDIKELVSKRVVAVGGGNPQLGGSVVNAINNPGALEKSYSGIDAGLDKLQVSDEPVASSDEIAQRLLDGEEIRDITAQYPTLAEVVDPESMMQTLSMRGVLSDEEILDELKNKLKPFDTSEEREGTYTSEQVDTINRFVEAYKECGADGILMASMDNEGIKSLSGGTIDLDAAGFSSPADLLNTLNPNWSAPYNINPGINYDGSSAIGTVGRGAENAFRGLIKLPNEFVNFATSIGDAVAGKLWDYDPDQDNSYHGRVSRNFRRLEQQRNLENQYVATKGQVLGEQVVSEVVRNALTAGMGGALGAGYAAAEAANLGGVPLQMLSNVASIGDSFNTTVTLLNRLPFAVNVFLNDYNQQIEDGSSALKAFALSSIHTAVELFTEGPAFERWSNLRFGGFSLVEHANIAINAYGSPLVSWGVNAVNNILSEINEEEFSELAERVIGTVVDVSEGKNVGESFKENFADYPAAISNTALTTALTTSIFGFFDMGGMVYNVMMDSMSSGQPVDTDTLITAMEVDRYANEDTPTEEDIADKEAEGVKKWNDFKPAEQTAWFKGRTEETDQQMRESAEATVEELKKEVPEYERKPEGAEANQLDTELIDTAKAVQRKADDKYADAVDEAYEEYLFSGGQSYDAEGNRYPTPAADKLAEMNQHLRKAQKTLDEAVKNYTKEQTEENQKAVSDALAGVQTAINEDRAEAAQKAAEEAAKVPEQNIEEEQEAPQKAAPELSEGAQRVRKFMEHADAAMDEAVVSKGAELEAIKAVEEDAGLRSMQASIDRLQSKSDELVQRITGMQQTAQKITGQLRQVFEAAYSPDINLDRTAPQVLDASNKKIQAKAAVESDIAAEQEKKDSIDREAEDAQKKLEEEKQRTEKEAREKAEKEYQKKLEEKKKEAEEKKKKAFEDARKYLFERVDPKTGKPLSPQQSASQALLEMDLEAEKDQNYNKAKQTGSDVHSFHTDEQYKANRAAIKQENEARMGDYARSIKQEGAGFEATEEYVDQNAYTNWTFKGLTDEARESIREITQNRKNYQFRTDANGLWVDDELIPDAQEKITKILENPKSYVDNKGKNNKTRRITPLITDRRSEEWQDEAKQRQEYLTSPSGIEEEQQERLNSQFQEYIEKYAPTTYLPVSYAYYKKIMDKANAQPGARYNDRRYGYVTSALNESNNGNGDVAEVVRTRSVKKSEQFIDQYLSSDNQNKEDPFADGTDYQREAQWYKAENDNVYGDITSNQPQVYSAADILDASGNLTAFGYQAIAAADPFIADDYRARSVSKNNGGVAITLEHYNENDRYLILNTPADSYEKITEKSDEQRRYEELTKANYSGTTGLYREMKRMETVQNDLVKAESQLQNAVSVYMQAEEAFRNADEKSKKKAAIQYKKSRENLKNVESYYDMLQNSLTELQKNWNNTEEFIRNYTPAEEIDGEFSGPGTIFYVIDKSMLPKPNELANLGMDVQADITGNIAELIGKSDEELADMVLKNALGQLDGLPEDSMELMEQMARTRIKNMNRNDLIASITSNLASTYRQKRLAEMFNGAVQVFKGDFNVEKFIEENGGTSPAHIGGSGFSTFISRDHYKPGNVYLVSEEAALRFLNDEEQNAVKLNRTAAQYNAYMNSSVNAFARKNGLSDDQAAALRGARTIGKKTGSRDLINSTSTAVTQDDTHILAVPKKSIGNPKSNTWIREADGSYSPEMAKFRLQRQLEWMIAQSDAEENGDIDIYTSKPAVLNLKDNSIVVYFTDEHGVTHDKGVKVGAYYNWYNGGSKFFPSYEWLMENADKIVCNFPCEQKHPGYNNYPTLVQFTLVPESDMTQGHSLSAELNNADYGAEQSELGYLRGHRELKEEFDNLTERFKALKGLPYNNPIKRAARLAGMNATFDLYKNELRTALRNASNATKDKIDYWRDKAVDLQVKLLKLGKEIEDANTSAGNPILRENEARIARDRKYGYNKYLAIPGFGTPADVKGQGLGEWADRAANEAAISNLRRQRGRTIFADRYAEPGFIFQGNVEYRNELDRIDSEISRRENAIASSLRKDASRFNGRIHNAQYMETVRGRERTKTTEPQKFEHSISAAERLQMAEERYEELTLGERSTMYDLPFFDVEKAALARIIPMLREEAEQEAANAPAEQTAPKQPDPLVRKIAEELVKEESTETEEAKEESFVRKDDGQDNQRPFRVIIAGSRGFNDYETLKKYVDKKLSNITGPIEIVSGMARGADTLGVQYAKEHGYSLKSFPAEWNRYGRSAGMRRNADMAENADALIAFWDGKSTGTKNMIELAKSKGLKVGVKVGNKTEEAQQAEPITTFRGGNYFLSNFYDAPVTVNDITYKNAEAAFQAQKLENPEDRQQFANLDGKAAKRLGRKVQLRSDWEAVKNDAMKTVVEAKFKQNPELAKKLAATGNADLIEGNTWGDTYWGVSNGSGENNLGKILMDTRSNISTDSARTQDIAKLAILKDLSDSGADIDDIRTQETEKFHDAQMEGMSDQEKLDYVANLANQAATGTNSPLIDPNTKYDAKLGEVIEQQAQKNNKKQQRRINAIARTVYKTERGINNALAELDEFEKAGHDVTETRNALNKQLEGIRNPNQKQIDAVVDSVSDPDFKINLLMHSDTTTEAALNEADAEVASVADDIFDSMSRPREIVTQFEEATKALENSVEYIRDEADIAEFTNMVVGGQQRLNDIQEEINESYTKYEQATSKYEKDSIIRHRKELESERDKIKNVINPAIDILLGNKTVDDAVANIAVFGPAGLQGNGESILMDAHRKRRQQSNENANKLEKELHANTPIHGKNTIYTAEELGNAFGKVIDEKQLAQNKLIADAFSQRVRQYKKNIATIDLAKAYATGDTEKFNKAFDSAMQTISELYPERGYTIEEWEKNRRLKDKIAKELKDYIGELSGKYNIDLEGDALYRVLDEQKLVFEAAIDRAERISKNYYKISAKSLADVFHGEHGGHKPMQIIQANYSLIRKSIKKWGAFHPIAINFDNFAGVCRKVLGKNADIFISQFVEPVRVAEAKAVHLRQELEKQYEWMRSLDKETKQAITKARHNGTREEVIRSEYPDKADTILKGVETAGKIFDTLNEMINVVYGRNGIDLLKRRKNYVPFIPLEKNPILRALGINAGFEEIPLKDFGKTSEYKPIHEFFRYAYERTGNDLTDDYEQDIVNLLDTYLPSAMTQIFQTDNIVAMRDMIECIRENGDYDDMGRINSGGYSFVTALENYCDVVSGKKTGYIDRAIERNFGRKYFTTVKALTQIVGQSATGANANVIAANFEPLVATMATNPIQTLKAIHDTVLAKKDGTSKQYINNSNFLTVRLDEKNKAKTKYQRAVQIAYKPAEWSDAFVSEVIHRAAYYNACERLEIDPDGNTNLNKKARENADNYCVNAMASKGRGDKAGEFNTSHGSVIFQYMQESINNIRHLTTDLGDYAGNTAESIGKISGTAKAIAALLAALLGHEIINRATGNDILPAVATPTIRAIKNRKEDDTILDTAGDIAENLAEGLNPFDNLLDNNSDIPIIGGVPVVSNVEQTVKGLISTAEKGFNAIYGSATGKEYKPNETDWAYTLASTILKWMPAGTQMKRGLDTGVMANRGYALSQKGRLKYTYNPTPGNVALSLLFGPNASIEGREYVNSGFATQSDANTDVFLKMVKAGMNPRMAYNAVKYDQDARDKAAQANNMERWGEDTSAINAEAAKARELQGIPKNLSPDFYGDANEPWMKNALMMWQKTGENTYPVDLKIYNDPERGSYIMYNNKNIPVDESVAEKARAFYHKRASEILTDYSDHTVVSKKLKDLRNELKKKILGGEYNGEDEDRED